jgi:hypothetical protein
MSIDIRSARLATIAAAGAALALAVPAAAHADQRHAVAANAHVKVVKTDRGGLVVKSLVTGHRTPLGKAVPASLVDVDGNYVGYARRFSNRVGVISIDARTGKVRRSSAAENVLALEVRRTGTLVWITQHGDERSVHLRNVAHDSVLGTGDAIDPRSLALADSGATTAHVYWTDGNEPHVAAIE